MRRFLQCMLLLCSLSLLTAQTTMREKPSEVPDQTDVDPLALKVLKAVTDPIHNAKAYSFKTRAMREDLGSNGQIITNFTTTEIFVSRPNKLRVNFSGRGRDVQLFYDGERAVLYSPGPKLYATLQTPKSIDAALDALEKRGLRMPVKNFVESDPYQSVVRDLQTGYVIGRVDVYGKEAHQLAFTEATADWQLWVTGGPNPRVQKLQVIDKERPGAPRTVVEFSDWNFDAPIRAEMFSFKVPPGAKEIQMQSVPKQSER
jgi:hypothetical protein